MRNKLNLILIAIFITTAFSCRAVVALQFAKDIARASAQNSLSGKSNFSGKSTDPQFASGNKISADPDNRADRLRNDAIIGLMGVESSSEPDKMRYNTTGPNTGRMGCARGFSQIMDEHLNSSNPNEWAMKYLGQPVDSNFYNNSPETQLYLTNSVIGDYANELMVKYPNYSDQQLRSMIYSKWFTGSYFNGSNGTANDGYTSAPQYVYKAENYLAKAYKKGSVPWIM